MLSLILIPPSLHKIAHEHCYRHWTYSTWYRRNRGADFRSTLEVDISNDFPLLRAVYLIFKHLVYSNVNCNASWLETVPGEVSWLADSADEDISHLAVLLDIGSQRMTQRDCGILFVQ